MNSFMKKHSHASNLLNYNAVDDKASALNYGKKTINPNVDTSDNPSRIETTVEGDLPSGGYSKKQKNLALAQAYAATAEKKDKEKEDPRRLNRNFRANDPEGKKIVEWERKQNIGGGDPRNN